jgi:hypothetical protein
MSLGSWIDAAVHDYYVDVQPLHTLIGRASPLVDDLRKTAIEGLNTGEFFTLAGGMGQRRKLPRSPAPAVLVRRPVRPPTMVSGSFPTARSRRRFG